MLFDEFARRSDAEGGTAEHRPAVLDDTVALERGDRAGRRTGYVSSEGDDGLQQFRGPRSAVHDPVVVAQPTADVSGAGQPTAGPTRQASTDTGRRQEDPVTDTPQPTGTDVHGHAFRATI